MRPFDKRKSKLVFGVWFPLDRAIADIARVIPRSPRRPRDLAYAELKRSCPKSFHFGFSVRTKAFFSPGANP